MTRAIVTIGIVHLFWISSALAQADWTTHPLGDAPEVWRVPIGAAGGAFPEGLTIAGEAVRSVRVHPQGFVILNDILANGADIDPGSLDAWVGSLLIAPFWAELADRVCPQAADDAPPPTVRWRFDDALTIEWLDMPHADCEPSRGAVSASMTLSQADDGGVEITLRYADVGATGAFDPRAGVVIRDLVFELLADDVAVPDRAKALIDGGSERVPFIELDAPDGVELQAPPPAERGVWRIELDGEGRVLGDIDQDGIRANDNCPFDANPLQLDHEHDGDGDVCDDDDDGDWVREPHDNCPWVRNPDQANLDRDRWGDACDGDDDGDGWLDHVDRCPRQHDPAQLDLDGDGRGDACDPDPDGDDPGAFGREDTCPLVADPARKDADRDGLGDACDLEPRIPCFAGRCAWQRDSDGDGVGDTLDLCPSAADPQQKDLDRDGVGDACDPDRNGDGRLDDAADQWLEAPTPRPLLWPAHQGWSP